MKNFLTFIAEEFDENDRRKISDYLHNLHPDIQQVRIDHNGMVSLIDGNGHKRVVGSVNRFKDAVNKATVNDNQPKVSILPKPANDVSPQPITKQDLEDLKINSHKPINIIKTSPDIPQSEAEKEEDKKKTIEAHADLQSTSTSDDVEIVDRVNFSQVETKNIIKSHLAKKYPGIKFGHRSKNFSGGSSIDLHYTDGPILTDVRREINQFRGRDFDGMQDLATTHYADHNGKKVRYGYSFVGATRKTSKQHLENAVNKAYKNHPEFFGDAVKPEVVQDWDKKGHYLNYNNTTFHSKDASNQFPKNLDITKHYRIQYGSDLVNHYVSLSPEDLKKA